MFWGITEDSDGAGGGGHVQDLAQQQEIPTVFFVSEMQMAATSGGRNGVDPWSR